MHLFTTERTHELCSTDSDDEPLEDAPQVAQLLTTILDSGQGLLISHCEINCEWIFFLLWNKANSKNTDLKEPTPHTLVGLYLQAPDTPGCPSPFKKRLKTTRTFLYSPTQDKSGVFRPGGLTCTLKSSPALTAQPSLIGSLLPRYSAHCRAGGP